MPNQPSRPSASTSFEPAYQKLLHGHKLQARAEQSLALLQKCRLCPLACGADRGAGEISACGAGRWARIGAWFPHFGEEACLRGRRGSGAIYFAACNLRCVFCHTEEISHRGTGTLVSPEQLADIMLQLQAQGCHNINLMTPSHIVPQLLEATAVAAQGGLRVPLIYNTSAYDSVKTLKLLEGVIDIYLPDFKFWDPAEAQHYLGAADYPATARAAIMEMHRQVGTLTCDSRGLAQSGVLVRHLVMPNDLPGAKQIIDFLAAFVAPDTWVSIMSQYRPTAATNAGGFAAITRRPGADEYRSVVEYARAAGLRVIDDD